ncbi:DUF423 domain-containing protein [Flavobacterium sp.]|uniref:DUF423 domain-containing protein n=1 Tax=Flavobacterium sp. TaxID=239 RepID=UPI00262848B5|nr:DUF423 domain-containing protein [Flavobacterium sp.]
MDKKILSTAGFLGMTAILLGAFGAHALKEVLDTEALATFETGVKYQMYHALLLLFLGSNTSISFQLKIWVYRLVLIGVVLFSGSIYLLATKSLSGMEAKFVGPLTPVGGSLLIGAWGILMVHFLKKKA